jgi:hypothetical protein
MRAVRKKQTPVSAPTMTNVLLAELREECERVAGLIRRLEESPASARVRDDILGDLNAAVLHLHAHTASLDEFLCEME